MSLLRSGAGAALLAALAIFASSVAVNAGGDIPEKFVKPDAANDYIKRVEMIPMRDGVKLYTVIVIPKGAKDLPIILTRTPYNAKKRAEREASPVELSMLPLADEVFVRAGYIRVYQDIRGKYGSEGAYEMTRFPRGPFNATKTDDTTDAWDTVDWLVKHVTESNGRVGMIGSSYEGWTVVMALLDPHPALKAAVPESPMVDGWMGDDWFHYGAFRQPNMDYTAEQTEQKGEGHGVPRPAYDDYENFLNAGIARRLRERERLRALGWWRKMAEHPAYDAFWQAQALDKLIAEHPSECAHALGTGPVGSGRHVGREPFLPRAEGRRTRSQQLAGDGPVVSQPGQSRRLESGLVQMGRRHRAAIPPRHGAAVLQSISERRAAGEPRARDDLQPVRKPLAAFRRLADGLRERLRASDDAALSAGGIWTGLRANRRGRGRLLRLRSCEARSLSAAARALLRYGSVAHLARARSALRRRTAGRSDV